MNSMLLRECLDLVGKCGGKRWEEVDRLGFLYKLNASGQFHHEHWIFSACAGDTIPRQKPFSPRRNEKKCLNCEYWDGVELFKWCGNDWIISVADDIIFSCWKAALSLSYSTVLAGDTEQRAGLCRLPQHCTWWLGSLTWFSKIIIGTDQISYGSYRYESSRKSWDWADIWWKTPGCKHPQHW